MKEDEFQSDEWQLGSSGIQEPDSGSKNPTEIQFKKEWRGGGLRLKKQKKKTNKKKTVKC